MRHNFKDERRRSVIMERISTCEMRKKDVINLCGGARLGHATDFEFDVCDGRVTAVIVTGECGFLGFGGEEGFVIPWGRIECIGTDAVLVKMPQAELDGCRCGREKHKERPHG